VGELRALVRSHPLRERLRVQLMLALYRSGRQSEALDAYADARRALVDEVGLEPGPELRRLQRAILDHDPALAPEPITRSRRRRRWSLIAAVGVAAVAGAVAVAVLGRYREPPRPAVVRLGGELIAVDAGTGKVTRRIPAGRTPAAVAVADGRAWLIDADALTLMAVDTRSGAVETLATGATPTDLAAGAGSVWVANGNRIQGTQFPGPVATSLTRFDPATRTARAHVGLPRSSNNVTNRADNHVAVSASAVWAVTPDFAVVRIDPTTAARTTRSRAVRAAAVAAGEAGVWVLGVDGIVVRLDERTARERARTHIPTDAATAIAVGADAAWVTSADGTLWRVGTHGELGSIDIGVGIADLAATASGVWVANPLAETLVRVDPATTEADEPLSLGAMPRSLAADDRTVWVAASGGTQSASASSASGVTALPESMCEPVIAPPGGRPDVLVVSDLPLQGGQRLTAVQMSRAIEFVLRERGFRAGRLRVAYQSCDDSVARSGLYDEPKCAANARSYASRREVIGVIGTLNSDCMLAALPALSRGRVPTVSPANSFVGMTRPADGIDPSLPARLYPTGRNYVRVQPTDDLQGAALALLARKRGRRRVFVLDDGMPGWGVLIADGFQTAARRLGLSVLGRTTWDPAARDYRGLARRIARTGADAVFVSGLLDANGAQVVRDLRTALDADILASDLLTPVPQFVEQAGEAASGTYITAAGLLPGHLPPAGARFVERFQASITCHRPACRRVEKTTVYAAQAASVLLDAIARSDGTRASVVDELFRTRVADGLLGTFRFDANGDIDPGPVTVLRVRGAGRSRTILSVDGTSFERVLRPSTTLVARQPEP
jgi:branched-chain amino acid transport system substrate-binding protein